MASLSLFDTSALVYAGNYNDNYANQLASKRFNNVPVGGLKYAINFIFSSKIVNSIPIAVLDSKTDKKETYSDYKGNREFNNSVFTQLQILEYLLPKLGVYTSKADGYEADDLIYSLVYANKNSSENIYVYADDSDLAGCILGESIIKIGTSSKTSIVTAKNYASTVRRNKLIEYNTVLPYYLFKGKESNNVKSLPHGTKLYDEFIAWFHNSGIPKSQGSERSTMAKYLQYCLINKVMERDFVVMIMKRMDVVYPQIHKNPASTLKEDFNPDVASEYLSILGLKEVARILGVTYKDPDSIENSKFLRWLEVYNTGVVHVDKDVPADKSYWFNNDTATDSGNVGGF
jgi:hypothetical protein